ncbi:MAG: hypothetical protein NZ741_13225, partial [Armatimonadetes bacterium]|nr:hypothetical protein [Armatimonadota bacterium]
METLEEASRGIAQHRQGEVVLRFQRVDGSPIPGLAVHISQQHHDFLFGCPLRPVHYNDSSLLERFRELFNFVEL